MLLLLFLVFLALWLLLLIYRTDRRPSALPSPGPCLPFLGHLPQLITGGGLTDPVNRLWKLYRQHSKKGILRVRAFTIEQVFIGDFATIKEVFNHPDVQARAFTQITDLLRENRGVSAPSPLPGLIVSSGEPWLHQRRFTLRALKDFGFGKASMENMISAEVAQFSELLRTFQGRPVDLTDKFALPLINILWRLVAGEQFEYGSPKMEKLLTKITHLFQMENSLEDTMMMAFPWMNRIPPLRWFLKRQEHVETYKFLLDMMRTSIEEHEQSLDTDSPRDFIDVVLKEIQETLDPSSNFYGETGKNNLANILIDLFLAGGETSSTTLAWATLYMVRHPEVQEKVQQELDQVVGRSNLPGLEDRPRLPYTEATIMEIQRMANIAPQGIQHVTTKDVTINGFTIPADTVVSGLFTELLKGSHWGDGTTFRPSRFLGSNGVLLSKDPHFVPFSLGRRQCLGEGLAKAELFLFFSSLLHQFTLRPEVEGQPPSEDYCPGLTVLPKVFHVVLTSRDSADILS